MFCCLRTCRSLNGNLRKPTNAGSLCREPEIRLDSSFAGSEIILLSNQLRVTGTGGVLATAPLVQSKSYFEIKIQQAGYWSVGVATRQSDLNRKFGGGKESWCLCSDNATRHNDQIYQPVVALPEETTKPATQTVVNLLNENDAARAAGLIGIEDVPEDDLLTTGHRKDSEEVHESNETALTKLDFPDEGDIVGVAFDHIELNFFYNGKNLDVPFRNVKGAIYPVVYAGNGAIVDIILDNFHYDPPPGFDRIMLEQSLL